MLPQPCLALDGLGNPLFDLLYHVLLLMAHRNPFLLVAYKVAEIIEAAKYMSQGFKYVVGVGGLFCVFVCLQAL